MGDILLLLIEAGIYPASKFNFFNSPFAIALKLGGHGGLPLHS
jgi:hypothetical protein